jgi:hypothetical protein
VTRAWFCSALVAGTLVSIACSDERPPPSLVGTQGGGSSGKGGSLNRAGSQQADAGQATGGAPEADGGDASNPGGAAGSSAAGSINGGGAGSSGTAGTAPVGGEGPDPFPPVGDPPLLPLPPTFGTASPIAVSGGGDDVFQAITPDELTIAWKNGDTFYVADRASSADPFGTPSEIAGSADYNAVSVPDGQTLIAVRKDRSVVELVRDPGEPFADPSPAAFEEFNNALLGVPGIGQVLTDAVMSADRESFFFSFYLSGETGSHATVQESRRSGGYWTFSGSNVGNLLNASGAKRRVPTGLSSDRLTLFYKDEVNGDFRAAWRVNPSVPFLQAEPLQLGTGTVAAAPNQDCSKIYFSAQGAAGIDLFVTDVTN